MGGDLGTVITMVSTVRFGMPMLVSGQGQKEITHNEALVLLDAILSCIVERRDLTEPPIGALDGQCWLVPEGATGDWSGRAGEVAISTAGGWRYLAPPDGATVFDRQGSEQLRRLGGSWCVIAPVGAPAAPIPLPAGGTVVDSEARAAIGAIVQRMMAMGLIAPS